MLNKSLTSGDSSHFLGAKSDWWLMIALMSSSNSSLNYRRSSVVIIVTAIFNMGFG